MIPTGFAVFMTAAFCCATALYVRYITRHQAVRIMRMYQERCQTTIEALSKGIQDEARLREIDPLDLLNGVLQQARKHGIEHGSVQLIDKGKTDGKHPNNSGTRG